MSYQNDNIDYYSKYLKYKKKYLDLQFNIDGGKSPKKKAKVSHKLAPEKKLVPAKIGAELKLKVSYWTSLNDYKTIDPNHVGKEVKFNKDKTGSILTTPGAVFGTEKHIIKSIQHPSLGDQPKPEVVVTTTKNKVFVIKPFNVNQIRDIKEYNPMLKA